RQLVSRLRLGAERLDRLVETVSGMRLQLTGPTGRLVDRVAVTRQRHRGIEVDRPRERGQGVAEGMGGATRPEADRGRGSAEEVVGRDEDAVPEKAELAVRVARCTDELPAVDRLSGGDQDRVSLIADERPVDGALADELARDVVGRPVQLEPV